MRSALVAGLAAGAWLGGGRAVAPAAPALVIEHADQVQRLSQGDSVSYYLDGNVRARRGDLRLTAQHAVVLEWLGLLDLTRDVHLWDEDRELYADHVTYTDSIDLAVATGDVQVVDRATGSELHAQQVVYDRPAGVLTATQEPEMVLLPESARDSAAAPLDTAAAAQADTTAVPIRVWSQQVQLFTDSEDVVATGDVLIRRGEDLTAKADSARRSGAEQVLRLRGKPRVETDRFYVEGVEIDVLLPDDELEALVARGQARASSVADSIPPAAIEALGSPSANSWLSADSLRFVFEEETLRAIRALGAARSLSYGLESRAGDAVTWALNYLLAGRISLHFDAGGEALERVEASQEGRGVYRTAALAGPAGQPVAPPPPGTAAEPAAADSAAAPLVRPAELPLAPAEAGPTAVSDTLPLLPGAEAGAP